MVSFKIPGIDFRSKRAKRILKEKAEREQNQKSIEQKRLGEIESLRDRTEQAIGIAKRRAQASRDMIGAEREAADQQLGAVRRRTSQAVAASFDPFQAQGGGQFAALGQVAADRGAQDGMIEAAATRRIGAARVAALDAELDAAKFEQEATPDGIDELAQLDQQLNVFAQSSGTIGEQKKTAQEARRLAGTARTPYARHALLARAEEIEAGREDV